MNTLSDTTSLLISRLGRDGDGMADTAHGPVFIPNALPGERFVAAPDGSYVLAGDPAAERITPPCRHFEACGGCMAQHMAPALYTAWKSDLIVSAFRTQKIEISQTPLFVVPPQSRRRAALTAHVAGQNVRLGYHARRSHTLIDLSECPVLAAPIVAALPALRDIARLLSGGHGSRLKPFELRISVASLTGGLDVSVEGGDGKPNGKSGTPPDMPLAAQLAIIARRSGLARLTVEGLTVCSERDPQLITEAGAIVPPPGAFFQAAAEAETRMTALILEGVSKSRRIADLFCGSGTFTLPLARRARILAVDSDKAALGALQKAARLAPGLKPIEVRLRDLHDEPLSALELTDIDAVVIDPPRAGAKTQMEAIVRSKVKTVVAVSCNPATLARDCRILLDAGFEMGPVAGVDQFLWSPHVEAVVTLTRRR
jgi:23S rRNA (uracil1939-C5)-methyltransferase